MAIVVSEETGQVSICHSGLLERNLSVDKFAAALASSSCTMTIKEVILKNWKPKLTCVLLATALWYLIQQNVQKIPAS